MLSIVIMLKIPATLDTMNKSPLCVVLNDIRSAGNVGAILRTADACGVETVYICGYTPYPSQPGDTRPPHVADSNTRAIAKTALGAEQTIRIQRYEYLTEVITALRHNHYEIAGLEQAESSSDLFDFHPTGPLALILGNEVDGIAPDTLAGCDHILELPMIGHKESLNVATAAGIALYHLRFGR
jgi:23S rRNA (guanosine2251-2'-O)-methyltransferase